MSLTSILLEFNVTDEKDAVNRILELIDEVAVEVDHYIASGYWGDVFKVKGKNKVVKLTNSSMEFNIARGLIDENFDHVINIFFARQVRWYKDQPFLIIGEYLETDSTIEKLNQREDLEITLQEAFDSIVFEDRSTDFEADYLIDSITKYYNEQEAKEHEKVLKQIGEGIEDEEFYRYLLYIMASFGRLKLKDLRLLANSLDLINDIIKGLKELNSVDIKHSDLHFENVLKDPKTGNYKLIDIQ